MGHGTTWGRRVDERGRCSCGATPGLDADGHLKHHRDPEGNVCTEGEPTGPVRPEKQRSVCPHCGLYHCACEAVIDRFETFINRGRS